MGPADSHIVLISCSVFHVTLLPIVTCTMHVVIKVLYMNVSITWLLIGMVQYGW